MFLSFSFIVRFIVKLIFKRDFELRLGRLWKCKFRIRIFIFIIFGNYNRSFCWFFHNPKDSKNDNEFWMSLISAISLARITKLKPSLMRIKSYLKLKWTSAAEHTISAIKLWPKYDATRYRLIMVSGTWSQIKFSYLIFLNASSALELV